MFSDPKHKKVVHFGLLLEDSYEHQDKKAAISILQSAIDRTIDDHALTEEVETVLQWLEETPGRRYAARKFRVSFSIQHPYERRAALTEAYVRILRELGFYNGRI